MSYVTLTKEQLQKELKEVQAAQRNPARFGVLYERYYKPIFLFVYKRTDDEDICADITSQVFLKAMLNLKKYTYKGVPFSAWLYRIASNEVNQYYRAQKNNRVISLERNHITRVMGMVDEEHSPDQVELFQEVLLETIEELKEDDVQILELRFFEQRPFKDVGYILGITENNAKVKVYRILERLRKRLQKKLGGAA